MNLDDIKLFNDTTRWFRGNGETLIPAGHEGFARLFRSGWVEIELDSDGISTSGNSMRVPADCLALISGVIAGVESDFLAEIAKHHGSGSGYALLAWATSRVETKVRLLSGKMISTNELFVRCQHAIEAADEDVLRNAYRASEDYETCITVGLLSAKSPRQWPSSILDYHQQVLDGVPAAEPVEFFVARHNFLDTLLNEEYPHDNVGPRYDWLLERSGMLMDGVINKKIGRFSLWEELVWVGANQQGHEIKQGFVDYCFHKAPTSQRAAIRKGLSSMMVECTHYSDGGQILSWMKGVVDGTYLEAIPDSIVLQMNMIRSDSNADDCVNLDPQIFTALSDAKDSIEERLYREIEATPPADTGFHHFTALGFLDRADFTSPEQILSADLDRETMVNNMLARLEAFSVPQERLVGDQVGMQEDAVQYTASWIRRISRDHELDCSRLKSLSDKTSYTLALAGINPKMLPVMSNRSKGLFLEHSLGI